MVKFSDNTFDCSYDLASTADFLALWPHERAVKGSLTAFQHGGDSVQASRQRILGQDHWCLCWGTTWPWVLLCSRKPQACWTGFWEWQVAARGGGRGIIWGRRAAVPTHRSAPPLCRKVGGLQVGRHQKEGALTSSQPWVGRSLELRDLSFNSSSVTFSRHCLSLGLFPPWGPFQVPLSLTVAEVAPNSLLRYY